MSEDTLGWEREGAGRQLGAGKGEILVPRGSEHGLGCLQAATGWDGWREEDEI